MWVLVEWRPFFHNIFRRRKNELSWENNGDLEVDDQGGDDSPIKVCGKLRWANIEMVLLGLTIRCEYWWNVGHSSCMTFSWQRNKIAFENEANSDWMTKEATILLLKFVASSVGICSNRRTDRQPQHCHKMWSYGRELYFIEDIKDKKAIQWPRSSCSVLLIWWARDQPLDPHFWGEAICRLMMTAIKGRHQGVWIW